MHILLHLVRKKVFNSTSLLDIKRLFSFGIVVSAFFFITPVSAEEECVHSRLWCFECDSWTDSRCKDPFNETISHLEPNLLKRCQGCCVKIVTNKGTAQEAVKRTCTSNLQINLFLVDHVCMKESEGKGTMCFCESEACNTVGILRAWKNCIYFVILSIVFAILKF